MRPMPRSAWRACTWRPPTPTSTPCWGASKTTCSTSAPTCARPRRGGEQGERERLRVTEAQIARLEAEIDRMNAELAPLRSFVLPGGSRGRRRPARGAHGLPAGRAGDGGAGRHPGRAREPARRSTTSTGCRTCCSWRAAMSTIRARATCSGCPARTASGPAASVLQRRDMPRGLHTHLRRQSPAGHPLAVGDHRPDRRQRRRIPARALRRAGGQAAIASFALIPSELFQVRGPRRRRSGGADQPCPCPNGSTLITYQFLHGDILHLALQHAVPVGVRRQRRGRHGAFEVHRLLPAVRDRRRPGARLDAAELAPCP